MAILASVSLACAQHAPRAATLPVASGPTHARGMPLPLPAPEVARMLARERFELRDLERAPSGVTRVERAQAEFPERRVDLPVKWKVAPSGGEGWNNVPRKEIAAFAIQQWFLDPPDWIVPPTAVRCLPVEEHRRVRDVEPIVEGTQCVLGMVAAWLEDVVSPEAIYDPERFRRDPDYARHRADMNVLGYLIDHRDGRLSNFLVPREDDGRIFLVDNGIAFGGLVWNYFVDNWNVIRVPALRRDAVDRLRRIGAADLSALLVLSELRADARGVLQPAPLGLPLDEENGARLGPGRVQLGLTADEVAGVAERLEHLLARVDTGEIPLF